MTVSQFKATCIPVLEQVRSTGEPVLVTNSGEPIAEIVPASHSGEGERELGDLAGTARIVGDIVSPVAGEREWDAPHG